MAKRLIQLIDSNLQDSQNPGYDQLDSERLRALSERDAVSYVNLCNGLGVSPEDHELYERGMAEILVDSKGLESFVGRKEAQDKKPLVSKRKKDSPLGPKYMTLYEVATELSLNPDNVFVQADEKRRVLREYMGYTKLIGHGGEKVLIDDAKDTRVGEVFKQCFYRGRDVYIETAR